VSQTHKTYLTRKEFNAVMDILENIDMPVVRLDALYDIDVRINATLVAECVFSNADSVEAVLEPSDVIEPPATLITKVIPHDIVEYNIVEYIKKKAYEKKIASICDWYECDYVIFK